MSIAEDTPRLFAARERWQQMCDAPDDAYSARQSMDADVELYRAERAAGIWP